MKGEEWLLNGAFDKDVLKQAEKISKKFSDVVDTLNKHVNYKKTTADDKPEEKPKCTARADFETIREAFLVTFTFEKKDVYESYTRAIPKLS